MRKGHLTLKIFSLIVLNDIIEGVAQLLMKKGLLHGGISAVGFNNILDFIARNASSVLLWAGILLATVNFFLWMIILHRIDLSIAMPVGSTIYIFVPLLALFFLNEHISPIRWAGILLIVAGIHFVAKSPPSTEGASTA